MGVCLTWIGRIEIDYKKMETNFVKPARIRVGGWSKQAPLNGISILLNQFILRGMHQEFN